MPDAAASGADPIRGHVYAVGIGPGAPDLLTLRAVQVIRGADVIICPRSSKSEKSMALETIRPWINGQELIEAVYPMRRDQKATSAFWRQMAEEAALRAEKGCVVAQITLGDPLLFSTSCYFLAEVQTLMSRGKVHVVPGIAAFQAVSARLKKALAVQEDRLLLMTGTETEQIKRALQECETLVLYKAGQNMQHIRRLLEEEGLLADSALVCYAEQKKEFVCRDLREYSGCLPGYLACVVIHVRRREWQKD